METEVYEVNMGNGKSKKYKIGEKVIITTTKEFEVVIDLSTGQAILKNKDVILPITELKKLNNCQTFEYYLNSSSNEVCIAKNNLSYKTTEYWNPKIKQWVESAQQCWRNSLVEASIGLPENSTFIEA